MMNKKLLLLFFVILTTSNVDGQIYIDIDSTSGRALPIAIVPLKMLDDTPKDLFEQFPAILARDLNMTGLFNILSPNSFLEPSEAGITTSDTDFYLWKKTGADALIKGGVKKQGDNYILEIRLFDVQLQESILGKRYYFYGENYLKAIHTFSDQIIKKLTGQPGVFASTQILCVGNVEKFKEIFRMSVNGDDLTRITHYQSITVSPDWSRDGNLIAYTSYIGGNPDLYIFDRQKKREKKISSRRGLNYGAAFSPIEDVLAVAVSNDDDQEIVLMNYKGKIIKTVTKNWWIDIEPSWSPDGKSLAFVSNQSGKPHIYRFDLETKNLRRLTYLGFHNVSPAWSPKGDKIAFAGKDKGLFDIFIMNTDGTNIQRLTKYGGNNEAPSWAPNGQMIVYSSDRTGKKQLYVMGGDGRGQTQITDGVGQYDTPSWSPIME